MNKYIKKCLMVYISLALLLVGMAGVTYAITSTDADQYITRSQFSVYMSELQLKLDEAESSVMGKLNKFRSTDVKFVTYNTPLKYKNTGSVYDGPYNGGNLFPIYRTTSSNTVYPWSPTTNIITNMKSASSYATPISLYRLWNGNYLITNMCFYNGEGSTPVYYWSLPKFAVPVENLPGWYLIIGIINQVNDWRCDELCALVKLDPSVSMDQYTQAQIQNMDLKIRMKKDLFQYQSAATPKYPYSTTTNTAYMAHTGEYASMSALIGEWRSNFSFPNSSSLQINGSIDPDTGDYITRIKGMRPSIRGLYIYYLNDSGKGINRFIPTDNVEYLGYTPIYRETGGGSYGFPSLGYMGTGQANDPYWTYEIVDCVNGIQYWHAAPKFEKTQYNGVANPLYRMHHSIPIVY